jgi:glucokinase
VTEVIGRAQWYLGLAAASIVNILDPELVVFGGGIVEALGKEFLAPIRTVARQYYIQKAGAGRVRIVSAKLGDHAGVLGAAVLSRRHLSAPTDHASR